MPNKSPEDNEPLMCEHCGELCDNEDMYYGFCTVECAEDAEHIADLEEECNPSITP